MRPPTALALLCVLGLLGLSGCLDESGAIKSDADDMEGLEPRGPIRIAGNDGFREPGNGVRSGNGTANDPYVIRGWYIDLTAGLDNESAAILLIGTDAHVQIRDCKVKRTSGSSAMLFRHASNVKLERCKVVTVRAAPAPTGSLAATEPAGPTESSPINDTQSPSGPSPAPSPSEPSPTIEPQEPSEAAVLVQESENVTIADTTIVGGSGHGIVVEDSAEVTVEHNQVSGNEGDGIVVTESTDVLIANNTAADNAGYGISVDGDQTEVLDNVVSENGAGGGGGILVEGTDVAVVQNEAVDNANYGIVVLPEAEDVEVRDNQAEGDDGGDLIILPENPRIVSDSNEGQVEPPGPDFDPRPPPQPSSGSDERIVVGILLLGLAGAGALGWFVWNRRAGLGGP